jgi:hypothetical protein
MTVEEAWNRGNNLVAAAVVTLAGFAFAPEIIIEDKLIYKVDDALLFICGIGAMAWYNRGNHRFVRSAVPILFVLLSLAIKIFGIMMEIKEKDDVGDDFGGLILFISTTLLVLWLYIRGKSKEIS